VLHTLNGTVIQIQVEEDIYYTDVGIAIHIRRK
jgi:hypothetical protein